MLARRLLPETGTATTSLRREIRRAVQDVIDPDAVLAKRVTREEAIRSELADLAEQIARQRGYILPHDQLVALQQYVIDDVLGYGPIQPLLDDSTIEEVMVNGAKEVFVERAGRIEPSDVTFDDDAHVMAVIERILRRLGRRVDEASPAVDARIPEAGFRVHVIIPPLALKGPTVTIRKFPRLLTMDDLIASGSVTVECARFLAAAVAARTNIIVSGGTGSGKTTLLNALSETIPDDQRIVTIEDTAELKLRKTHVVSLQARPASAEGTGAFTIRELVANALRMRPDRIIVGEVRRAEALDMLQAMNTGHDGSLSTVHANDPADVVSRLETMVLQSGVNYPLRAIRQQIQSAVQLIVQVARAPGLRYVESVAEFGQLQPDDSLPAVPIFRREGDEELRLVRRPRFVEALQPRLRPLVEAAIPA